MYRYLLAKTPSQTENPLLAETLVGHTSAVFQAAGYFSELLSETVAHLFQFDSKAIIFWKNSVLTGAWLHDCGKANSHFQRKLRDPSHIQGIRHEAVSLVIANDVLGPWLDPIWKCMPVWARCGAIFATSGHHLKFPDPFRDRPGTTVTIHTGHPNFRELLEIGREYFSLSVIPPLEDQTLSLLHRGEIRKTMRRLEIELDHGFSAKEKALIATIKTTVVCADLAGSAIPRTNEKVVDWLKERLETTLTEEQLIQVCRGKIGLNKPKKFQARVMESDGNTLLVEAGCGGGKTVAAYLWAAGHASGKRLFFCYPTTSTASEGFSGYLRDPDFDALLIHGRAFVDYKLLENMPARNAEEIYLRESGLEALETWPVPVVVCTSHTVLGLLENVMRGLYAWPSLSRAAFVFDEIHAFSDRLFSYLLRFLTVFGNAPVLLMTATLPPARKKALELSCQQRGKLEIVRGPEERERAARYALECVGFKAAYHQMEKVLSRGGKVLWICNTVNRALEMSDIADRKELPVTTFHSRFRYKDRLKRQRQLVDGFRHGNRPMIAVTTQVAEMSLDISADLLVSEYAPIPSLIQRLGRLNRFNDEPDVCLSGLFLEPETMLPYSDSDLPDILDWLNMVCDGTPKSQHDLSKAFIDVSASKIEIPEPVGHCEWLDGLWSSLKNVRGVESAGYSVEVIREEDSKRESLVENVIPMPFPHHLEWRKWPRKGRYLIAPVGTVNYDDKRGARWSNH